MDSTEIHHLLSLAMAFLPSGFRFHPTDEEVVANYLAGGRQEFVVIPEIDICKFEPEMLPIQFKEKSMIRSNDQEWWFLCKQEQGQKARRSTGKGYWKITGSPSEVKSSKTNQIIGSKRFLTFYWKAQGSKDIKSNWVMHEYCLLDANRSSSVICHVKLKADDNAVSRPSSSHPQTEPFICINRINGGDSTTHATGSWSISSPSVSSRSERLDFMDILGDSEDEHYNFSEGQIQMTMESLLSSLETPNDRFSQHSLIGDGDSALMEFSFSSEDQDSQFNFSEESEQQGFWNDFHGFDDQIHNQFGGTVEVQNSRREAANIRESTQTQIMEPGISVGKVCVIDEPKGIFCLSLESSSDSVSWKQTGKQKNTFESKLEGYGENSVPVSSVVSKRSGKLHDKFTNYEDSAHSMNRKIKMETEALKTKVKEVKKHGTDTDQVKKIESAASSCLVLKKSKNSGKETVKEVKKHGTDADQVKKIQSAASSCLVVKKSRNSGQETRLNCKTESRLCSSSDNWECESTPPICYLVNLVVGILLLIFFLGQVF